MNKKLLIFSILTIIILLGLWILKSRTSAPGQIPAQTRTSVQAPVQNIPETAKAPANSGNIVIYTDGGFEPRSLEIKKGDTVVFKNTASGQMWVASAVHPTHSEYPTTGGCVGSTFDACKPYNPGELWSFKFDFIGSWKYHNHLNPADVATIVVK